MTLFSKKELERLQHENNALHDKITSLEARLANSFPSHKVKEVCQEFNNYIDTLESELSALKNRPRNERGAGRKRKATSEQVALILSLSDEGKSHSAIAKILSTEYNEPWNKTTVRNVVLAAKN